MCCLCESIVLVFVLKKNFSQNIRKGEWKVHSILCFCLFVAIQFNEHKNISIHRYHRASANNFYKHFLLCSFQIEMTQQ